MRPFSIAGIQMKVHAAYPNLETMRFKLDVLMSIYPWVEMVVFSELAAYGPLTHHAHSFPNDTEKAFQEMAKKHHIWLIPGSMFEKKDEKIFNTATVINPNGEIVKRYRKMFPFLPYEEGVTGGEEFCIFEVPKAGKFGLSICYDMWFPETSRTLAAMGAEVIIHPTLTGTIDRDIELSIIRATSAINQCYIFDVNGLETGGTGKSLVCGPDGGIIYQADQVEEMIPIEIDFDRVKRSRENGLLRLGQPLKSFRSRADSFPIYQKGADLSYLHSLGPINKPTRIKKIQESLESESPPPTQSSWYKFKNKLKPR
ncbi:carbon-nitrogen hydrolase family protein [Flexithrix dorotheae]|uniref:carbon-nitrogen hydrolase family protein n=1 Tax=Flexithrix dorotheae TaxID=70993 RepID=UPI000378CBDE|nr:carbon-nitrogen hydrolase family protein [Flexithrix dorotheae]